MFAEKAVVALANAAFKRTYGVTLGRLLLVHVTLALALAVAQHLQIHREGLVDTNLQRENR